MMQTQEEDEIGSLARVRGDDVVEAERAVRDPSAADAASVRARVVQLRDDMANSYFELGGLLYRISRDGLYVRWHGPDGRPYQSFREYVEYEVEFQFRKAKYLMSTWWWFADKVRDPEVVEKVREIGWAKASHLVGIADAKNVDAWIEKAKELSVPAFRDHCRQALERSNRRRPAMPETRGSVGVRMSSSVAAEPDGDGVLSLPDPEGGTVESEPDPVGVAPLEPDEEGEIRTKWSVMVNDDQRINIEKAIDSAMELAEHEKHGKGYLLDLIATTFLGLCNTAVGTSRREHRETFRRDLLEAIERTLELDIIAFEKKPGAPILWGEKTVERLLGGHDAR